MNVTLLIYTHKVTPRVRYIFKHIFTSVLGLTVAFTSDIETFVAHKGPKLSYTHKQLGNELHFRRVELLFEQGINDTSIQVKDWNGVPCFFNVKSSVSRLPYDIFAASFYLLSRYEEYLPHVKDTFGRFPSSESLAFQNDFLQIPVIDEWIERLREVFVAYYPDVPLKPLVFRTNLTVKVPQVFVYRKIGFLRTVGGYVQDLVALRFIEVFDRTKVLLGIRKDPYDVFTWLVNFQKQSEHKFNVLFELGDQTSETTNVRYNKQRFQYIIKMMGDYCNVGLLASVMSSKVVTELKKETNRLEAVVNKPLHITQFANHQFKIPKSYRTLLDQEVTKDYSMGYPGEVGFRAGSCRPFLFYDLDYEMQTPLLLTPVSLPLEAVINVNDKTVNFVEVNTVKKRVQKLKGVLAVSCTNKILSISIWRSLLKKVTTTS